MKPISLPATAEIRGVEASLEKDPGGEVATLAHLAVAEDPRTGGDFPKPAAEIIDGDVDRPGYVPLGKLLRCADIEQQGPRRHTPIGLPPC